MIKLCQANGLQSLCVPSCKVTSINYFILITCQANGLLVKCFCLIETVSHSRQNIFPISWFLKHILCYRDKPLTHIQILTIEASLRPMMRNLIQHNPILLNQWYLPLSFSAMVVFCLEANGITFVDSWKFWNFFI